MDEKMKKAFQEVLLDGEQVLWESGTNPFRMTEGKEGRRIILLWIFIAIVCASFIVLRISQGVLSVKTILAAVVIFAVALTAPFVSHRRLLGQRYCLTDRRAILIKRDGSTFAMKLDGAPAKVFPSRTGTAISLGAEIVAEGDRQLRWRALHPLENPGKFDGYNASGFVFYTNIRLKVAKPCEQNFCQARRRTQAG